MKILCGGIFAFGFGGFLMIAGITGILAILIAAIVAAILVTKG